MKTRFGILCCLLAVGLLSLRSRAEAIPGRQDEKESKGEASSEPEASAAQAFESLYEDLQKHQESVMMSSRTPDYLDCAAYRRIVERGEDFLPFIVEKIREGDFFLNQAMTEITEVDIQSYFPEEETLGEQDRSRQWLRWWEEHREEYGKRESRGEDSDGSGLR